jgi:hypothetical protein
LIFDWRLEAIRENHDLINKSFFKHEIFHLQGKKRLFGQVLRVNILHCFWFLRWPTKYFEFVKKQIDLSYRFLEIVVRFLRVHKFKLFGLKYQMRVRNNCLERPKVEVCLVVLLADSFILGVNHDLAPLVTESSGDVEAALVVHRENAAK